MSRTLVCGLVLLALLAGCPSFGADAPYIENIGLPGGSGLHAASVSPWDPNLLLVCSDMTNCYRTTDRGVHWELIHHTGIQGTDYTQPATFHPKDPNTIFWNRDAIVKVSHDRGVTWKSYSQTQLWRDREYVTKIYLDPDYPARVFVGTIKTLYVTDDDGASWRECKEFTSRVFKIVTDRKSPADKRVYFVGSADGAFRSDDGGKTFHKKTKGLPTETLTGFAGGSDEKETVLYASTNCEARDGKLVGGVFRSFDKGETWQSAMNEGINRGMGKGDAFAGEIPHYCWLVASDRNPRRAYVFGVGTSYFPPNHSTVYRTDDAGDRWQATFFSDPRFKAPGMECNVETDWETTARGQRSQDIPWAMDISAFNPDMVVMSQERFYFYTMDAGKTWKNVSGGVRVEGEGKPAWTNNGLCCASSWNYYIDPFEKNRHYICYTDIGFARSLDAGKTWIWGGRDIPGGWSNTTYELAFDPEVKGKIWGAFSAHHDIPNESAIYRGKGMLPGGAGVSTDFGQTWKRLPLPVAEPVMSVVVDPKSPVDKRTVYASTFGAGVFRSDDGGETWQSKSKGLGTARVQRALKMVLTPDGTLYTIITGNVKANPEGVGVYKSVDKAETWTKISEGQNWAWIKDFTVKADDPNTLLVTVSRDNQGLYRTTDGGKTWEKLTSKGRWHFGAYYHPTRKGWIYLTLTESEEDATTGIWLSKDDGKTWLPYPKIPFAWIQRVAFNPDDPDHILLTTFGYSIIKAPVEP